MEHAYLDQKNSDSIKATNSLLEILAWRAQHQANRTAYIFLNERGDVEDQMSYSKLYHKSLQFSFELKKYLKSGERALLLMKQNLDFIASFFACQMIGAVPVPLNVPSPRQSLEKIISVHKNCTPSTILLDTFTNALLGQRIIQTSQLASTPLINIEAFNEPDVLESIKCMPLPARPDKEDIAFLQYTSGSTSTPKGVVLTHGNILSNQEMIRLSFEHDKHSTFVGWTPLHHDQGLVGNIFQPLYIGAPCVLMLPSTFIQKPLLWLETISKYQAKTSGGPNFAYDLCLRRATESRLSKMTLDLSSWSIAFNGADTVRAHTIEAFSKKFEPFGFRRDAFYPCYGLAEASLLVSAGPKSLPPKIRYLDRNSLKQNRAVIFLESSDQHSRDAVVAVGQPIPELDLLIVDPKTRIPLAPFQVGEIWACGGNIARSYWGDQATSDMNAQLAIIPENIQLPYAQLPHIKVSQSHCKPDWLSKIFLKTGDLGFVDESYQLYINGRLKDLIVVEGINFYPQDLELCTQNSDPALYNSVSVISAYESNGTEKLLLIQEVAMTLDASLEQSLKRIIREALSKEYEILVNTIVFVPKGTIPKTSSGKVQRRLAVQRFLDGTYNHFNNHLN